MHQSTLERSTLSYLRNPDATDGPMLALFGGLVVLTILGCIVNHFVFNRASGK